MENSFGVLIVSPRPENRKICLGVLGVLPVSAFAVSTLAQARELMASRPMDMVFCEEQLSDGSYREILSELRATRSSTQFVLLMNNGEWNEYLEALRLGVEEVLRPPLLPMDIDLAFIHSLRKTTTGECSSQI